jgi:hypothetical protein
MLKAKVIITLFLIIFLTGCDKDNLINTNFQSVNTPINLTGILISEILVDPKKDGVEFVEIYNNSNQSINLSSLQLASMNATGKRSKLHPVSKLSTFILPFTYKLLSIDSDKVQAQYSHQSKNTFHNMPSFPILTNTQGAVILFMNELAIDSLYYNKAMHNPFIKNPKGVSLERISFHIPSHITGSFLSAAASNGYATPGYQNSQSENTEPLSKTVFLDEQIFSLERNNHLTINIHLPLGGKMANIRIYNAKGINVRTLTKNQLIGTKESFIWDGKNEKNQNLPTGIYYIYVEIFDSIGFFKTYKESCILTNKI